MNESIKTVYELEDEISKFIALDRPLSGVERLNYFKTRSGLFLQENRTKLLLGAGSAGLALTALFATCLPRPQSLTTGQISELNDPTVTSAPANIPRPVGSVGCSPDRFPGVSVNGRIYRSQIIYGSGEAVFMRNIILRNYVPGLVLQVIPDMFTQYIDKSGIVSDINKVSLITLTSMEKGSLVLDNIMESKNSAYMRRYSEIFYIPPTVEYASYTVHVTEIMRDTPAFDRSNARLSYMLNGAFIHSAFVGINRLNKRPADFGVPSSEIIRAGGIDMQFINVVSADLTLPENPQIARLGDPLLYSIPDC